MPDSLEELETPVALVDVERMDANLSRAAGYCREHGLAWRPHTKTHKVPALAARQVDAGAHGVTVATLREAEVMATAVDDLLLAYPPLGEAKQSRLARLLASGVRLTVGLDSAAALKTVQGAARDAGAEVGVLVELDVGMRRVGVGEPGAAVDLARRVASAEGVEFRGVLFYPGHVRAVDGPEDPQLTDVDARLGEFLRALEGADLAPRVVSGGSTPTLWYSHGIGGLTEVRPGTSIFNDRATAAIGASDWSDCAYSVLATVVSTAVPGQAVVDAGSKALAREELRAEGGGYGALLDRPEVVVAALSEEHGVLDLAATDWKPSVGERVRVVPNHVCVSVNLQETLWGVRDQRVEEAWDVLARGRAPYEPSVR